MGILPDDNCSTHDDIKKQEKGILRKFFFKAYHPAPSVKTAIIVLSVLGLIFIIIGSVLISYSESAQEYISKEYNKDSPNVFEKNITIEIKKKMKKPVFLYYKIEDYYQNHRIYSLSKSIKQLQGNEISSDEAELSCTNYDKNKHIKNNATKGKDKDDIAYPCGLVAHTFFEDRFELFKNDESIPIEETKISWDYDRNSVFKNYDSSKQWVDFENGKKLFRTFYCVDENFCFGKVQKVVGSNR